jgi:hypothetical protein
VPIPKRSASPRATSTTVVVDGLKALDPKRPIREADFRMDGQGGGRIFAKAKISERRSVLLAFKVLRVVGQIWPYET